MATKRKSRSESVKATDIVEALTKVTKEKSIGIELVLDTLKDALATAAKRYLGKPINVEVNIDREKGVIEVFTRQFVVDEVEDPETQIDLEDAQEIDADLQVGDELIQDLDMDHFGRTAIQTAKQVIVQRVREAEREKIFTDYSDRIGELITGTVQQIDKGNILLNLGRTEAVIPYKEQIHRERYRQGDTIRGCIVDVKNNLKGPQVIVSRTSPMFLERLFELEVPEIFERIVRIIKVVRAPGQRAKVAVTSNDTRVDPVGACVGMRGNRVQAIVRELSNERMDIINWTDEFSLLVRRVFSPAEVKRVFPVGDYKLVVIIAEEDLAQAIGKEGVNIKLASKMLEREIDVYGDEEFANLTDEEREDALREETILEEEAEEFEYDDLAVDVEGEALQEPDVGERIGSAEQHLDIDDEESAEQLTEEQEQEEVSEEQLLSDDEEDVQTDLVEQAQQQAIESEDDVEEAIERSERQQQEEQEEREEEEDRE
ncbi:MAG: transcription termination factor NusA [Fibrobacterota bacterium]